MYHSCESQSFDIRNFRKTLRIASLAILGGFNPESVLPFVTTRYPQRDSSGNINYLLASGLAIQQYTNQTRKHRDIDFVLTTGQMDKDWHALKVDLNTGSRFWCRMEMSDIFLTTSAEKIDQFWLVNSAILLVQKSSNHRNLPPRPKDDWDAFNLANYCKKRQLPKSDEWVEVLNIAIASLPPAEQFITRERISSRLKFS